MKNIQNRRQQIHVSGKVNISLQFLSQIHNRLKIRKNEILSHKKVINQVFHDTVDVLNLYSYITCHISRTVFKVQGLQIGKYVTNKWTRLNRFPKLSIS